MLDIKFIIENKDQVQDGLNKKGYAKIINLDELISLHGSINKLKTSSQALAEEKNKLSNSIKSALAEERPAIIAKSKALGEELKKELEELDAEQAKFNDIMLRMPNVPSPECPVGPDESGNVVIRKVGEIPHFDFKPRDHVELMELNDWSEMERIAKVSGSRTYAIKNDLAKLELAMHMLVLDKLREHGFTVITVPSISKEKPLYGQGYLPFSRDEIYYMPADDVYLSGTAELILNSLRADEILNEAELPILYAGFSPCFRREAGSYGKDVRGLNRLHEFSKVELVRIDKPEHSEQSHQEMLAHVEGLLQKLELPYRILRLCGGDMSFTSSICYDFEVYSEAQKRWLEVSSVSNFDTYQANRLKCRYRRTEDKKTELCHTLNGSALALPRIVAAIMENNQTPEGIRVPKCLVPYSGFEMLDDHPC